MNQTGNALIERRIEERLDLMQAGLGRWHRVLTDEYVDAMAERFARLRVRELTGVSFEDYILDPDHWEIAAGAVTKGKLLRFVRLRRAGY